MPANATPTGLLVFGVRGQLGHSLQSKLAPRDDVTFLSRDEADFSNPRLLRDSLEAFRPSALINAAAYTAVDQAEEEPELADCVNHQSVAVLADFARRRDIPLLHFSTDYVFDGSGEQPRSEADPTNPLSIYGKSKLAGEKAVGAAGCKHLIFRTSWVYGAEGKNFANTMLRLGQERERLRVVSDQVGAPTYAPHLAQAAIDALDRAIQQDDFPSGVYHACNGGEVSWHGFACAIFEKARSLGWELKVETIDAISTKDYPTKAARPLNSRLSLKKLERAFGIVMPHWREGLDAFFASRSN